MKQIRIRLYWFKNWIIILWSKILKGFGYKYDDSVIPEGLYCYYIDGDDAMKQLVETGSFKTIPCPYYKTLGQEWNGCKYMGWITDDFVFDDQCKYCGVNEGINPIILENTGAPEKPSYIVDSITGEIDLSGEVSEINPNYFI